ncbi:helix-turn-helix domain-containing protein [Sellimonas intestinalis]|uniref:helix-turn-helix domain-containing protein n=1 Tax=Sellimonas intestinalis TaxID=1653434 RepID=UPI003995802A
MKQPSYKGYGPLPDAIIDAACAGDAEAIDRVLRHYDGYINKLCIRKVIGSDSRTHYVVDEYMKRRLQIELIHSIVGIG